MNKSILNIEIQEFINNNLYSEITALLFKKSPFPTVDIKELVEQIEAKKKCKDKLPTWFNSKNIYYPNKLNIEQTSSEVTAKYKSHLIKGKTLIDITGGLGVDTFYFSKYFQNVIHCEINKELSLIAKANFKTLKANNIDLVSKDGIDFLKETTKDIDWIYVDPSRRHENKGKVFLLEDCLPNIPELLSFLFQKTNNIMMKTSPLLDISKGINSLQSVKEIYCIAVNNEVKELLWLLEKGFNEETVINTINITKNYNQVFSFLMDQEKHTQAIFSEPEDYLYEPNAAILKAGAFNTISEKLKLNKLHPNSHLYTSHKLINDFPGRVFSIESVLPYSKTTLKKLKNSKANITTRNFSESVASIRKKHHITDGGKTYLFFTTSLSGKIIVETKKEIK